MKIFEGNTKVSIPLPMEENITIKTEQYLELANTALLFRLVKALVKAEKGWVVKDILEFLESDEVSKSE